MICAQELMPKVAVAMLQVHKIEADVLGEASGAAKSLHNSAYLRIRNRRRAGGRWKSRIQNRVMIDNYRLQPRFLTRRQKRPEWVS